MACRVITVNGISAIVCGPKPRAKPCRCGARSQFLCDWPAGSTPSSGTCDKPLCGNCAKQVGPDTHHCPDHPPRRCRQCGCTDDDCSECITKTGQPCHWIEANLCSACAPSAA